MTAASSDNKIVASGETLSAISGDKPSSELIEKPDSQIDIDLFARVNLRVGRIDAAEAVPKSKKLIKLQVNLGEKLGQRQILAGIAQFYTPESLVGKRVVVVANLKPAVLAGLESQGMLLAASNDDNSALSVLEPPDSIELGATVR